MSSKKVQAAARFDLRPPHAIPQDSTPVPPDTSYAATINWVTKPHVESAANFSGIFTLNRGYLPIKPLRHIADCETDRISALIIQTPANLSKTRYSLPVASLFLRATSAWWCKALTPEEGWKNGQCSSLDTTVCCNCASSTVSCCCLTCSCSVNQLLLGYFNPSIKVNRSDEDLTLEMTAFKPFTVANLPCQLSW